MELKEVIWRVGNNQLRRFNRTFMELKDASSAWKGAKVEGFNRTFMELKVEISAPYTADLISFNRTFMELKVSWSRHTRNAQTFQSHLYGIESKFKNQKGDTVEVSIAPLWNWKSTTADQSASVRRFNRTFMELKVRWTLSATHHRRFQSHLYGIERCCRDPLSSPSHVSIAPLWNWKSVVPGAVKKDEGFNRTFMELKVTTLAMAQGGDCFNRTFMELKGAPRPGVTLSSWFQSHLYGIESERHFWTILGNIVSIAPLWNWKCGCSWNELCRLCFNRTFMELKVMDANVDDLVS